MNAPVTILARSEAAALPLVLWAVFVMSTIVIVVLGLIDFDLDLEQLAGKRLSARELSLNGVALASHPEVKAGDPVLLQKFPDGRSMDVSIVSEDARLNINFALQKGQTSLLTKLFRRWGADERVAETAADSLKDWVDNDGFRSLNGTETGDGLYSAPENRPFLSVEEMRGVKGMDAVARLKPDWVDYFSVKSSRQLDVQGAPVEFLEIFGGLTPEQAGAVVAYRNGSDGLLGTADDREIVSPEALAGVVTLNEVQLAALKGNFGAGAGLQRVKSRGVCGGIVHEITVVMAKGQPNYLEWTEK